MSSLKSDKDNKILSFAEIVCDKICSGHNQHVMLLIEGKTGDGKSNAALELSYNVSLLMAERLGGNPEDYFTIDNIAILTGEEVIRIAKGIKQHGIYILDDVGAEGLSARNWQSDINEVMTKILQTFRTKENLLIMTVPDRGFVDKIARNLLHYKIVMAQKWFSRGITLGRLSTVRKMYNKDDGKNIFPYVRHKGVVYNYAYFGLAPKWLRDEYEDKRRSIEEEMRTNSIDEFIENIEQKNAKKNQTDKDKNQTPLEQMVCMMKMNNPDMSIRDISKELSTKCGQKCGKDKVNSILHKFNLTNEFLSVG